MSDYLGNLIARTVSPAAVVRPQLPSIFEPSPANRQAKSELDLEQEAFSESPPITQRAEKFSPTPPAIPAAHQFVSREPAQIVPQSLRVKGKIPVSEESEPAREDLSSAIKPRDVKPTAKRIEPSIELLTPEPRQEASRENQSETNSRSSRSNEAQISNRKSEIGNRKFDQSLLTPIGTIQKKSPVQAVVPAIRALRQVESKSTPPPEPTINVTIGRVEIRAASPPSRPRVQPKPASVLSLEDYLRQRANGGKR